MSDRHDGVSCDCCMGNNFSGKRFKCLVCYDFDLCAACYESGATSNRHSVDHPVQCILTRADLEMYFGNEGTNMETTSSFACPFCGKMGYTETTLLDHVHGDHSGCSEEVVCPVCAAMPGGEPNHLTDDFPGHLAMAHRVAKESANNTPNSEDSSRGFSRVRRRQFTARATPTGRPPHRGETQTAIPHYIPGGSSVVPPPAPPNENPASSSLPAQLLASSRDLDPIAELLGQLTIPAALTGSRPSARLRDMGTLRMLERDLLEEELEHERLVRERLILQQMRQQLERLPRRSELSNTAARVASVFGSETEPRPPPSQSSSAGAGSSSKTHTCTNQQPNEYLLTKMMEPNLSEQEKHDKDVQLIDRSLFLQDIFYSSLTKNIKLSLDDPYHYQTEDDSNGGSTQSTSFSEDGNLIATVTSAE